MNDIKKIFKDNKYLLNEPEVKTLIKKYEKLEKVFEKVLFNHVTMSELREVYREMYKK